MNILIPYSWLKEYLKTEATPKQIAYYLSLCSQSVEKITKTTDDYIYEIEITTNRSDCLSVIGIARELAAILPRFGIKTYLEPVKTKEIPKVSKNLPLEVKITKNELCPRFTALIFDNVKVYPSPSIIQQRLENSGIRALNNVVDISNYLMLELGQPMHTFDYDKIGGAKMILREANEGEEIITLDGQKRVLPSGAIIIEDGDGKIIDLCGIMGGENSAVDHNTKRVLLFVQTYNPAVIRRTCQILGFRTEAAQRFEKGVDPEGVIYAMKAAILLFEKNCQAKPASNLIDIYPHPPKPKLIKLSRQKLIKVLGIPFELDEAGKILEDLGFKIRIKKESLIASPPHWRYEDINIAEDLIEEIARIYGYHRLPGFLPQGEIPIRPKNLLLEKEEKIKDILKFLGFVETPTYSAVSCDLLQKTEIDPKECLKIANPLSEEMVFLRTSLIPSILQVIKNNPQYPTLKCFELANVYIPQKKNELPKEISTLTVAMKGEDFFNLKGILEVILKELKIDNPKFKLLEKNHRYQNFFSFPKAAEIFIENTPIGIIGEINPIILNRFEIDDKIVLFEINVEKIANYQPKPQKYTPISKYPPVIEDLTFIFPPKVEVESVIQLIKLVSPIIKSVLLVDLYKNRRTFRITYQSFKRNLNNKDIQKIREKIIKKAENLSLTLYSK